MKNIVNKMAFAGLMALSLGACKKDTSNQPVLNLSNASETLTVGSTTPIVLDSANNNSNVVALSWDSVKFGFSTSATYTLQFDKASDSWAHPQTMSVTGYTASLTGSQLNVLCNTLVLSNGVADTLEVRMKVNVVQQGTSTNSVEVAPLYSNVVMLNVNPYYIPVPLTYLYIPGAYQGWAPGNTGLDATPSLASSNSTNYEGFDLITAAGSPSLAFKITTSPDWSHVNMGDNNALTGTGNVYMGTLSAAGGNIIAPQAGYYFMQFSFADSALTMTQVDSFEVTGSAVGNTPINLTYDTVANVWEANNVTLTVGTLEYTGLTGGSPSLVFGQGPQDHFHVSETSTTGITVSAAGTYDIRLVLSSPLNYTDTLTKQ